MLLGTLALAHSIKMCASSHRPYGWAELQIHADSQLARYEMGEYPGRSDAGNQIYTQYKAWCSQRGISNAEYILKYVQWQKGCALEPCLMPYLLDDGLEHWILWHHPDTPSAAAGASIEVTLPGDVELDREREKDTVLETMEAASGEKLDRSLVITYQNVKQLRSIPQIAHAHVFFHVPRMPAAAQQALVEMRASWRQRSPWLNAPAES